MQNIYSSINKLQEYAVKNRGFHFKQLAWNLLGPTRISDPESNKIVY